MTVSFSSTATGRSRASYARLGGFTECTIPNSRKAFNAKIYLKQLGDNIPQRIHPWGLDGVPQSLAQRRQTYHRHHRGTPGQARQPQSRHPQLLQELLKRQYPIRVLYTAGHWLDINSIEDVVQAGNF